MVQPQRSGDRGERWRKDQCHSLKFLSCIRLTFTSDSIHIKTQGTLAPTGCPCLSVSISRLGACKQSKITASAAVPRACPAHRHFAGQSNVAFSCSARWVVGVIARDLPSSSKESFPTSTLSSIQPPIHLLALPCLADGARFLHPQTTDVDGFFDSDVAALAN